MGLVLALMAPVQAQMPFDMSCPTQRPQQGNLKKKSLKDFQVHLNQNGNIPVVVHVLEQGGIPVISHDRIREELAGAFAHFDFLPNRFEVEQIRGFQGAAYDVMDDHEAMKIFSFLNQVMPHKLHILFVKYQPDGVCGLTSLPPENSQGIVLATSLQTLGGDKMSCPFHHSIPHELAHYFFAQHTFEGAGTADTEVADASDSSCHYKGDGLCDTPADPGVTDAHVNDQCELSQERMDPISGLPFKPPTKNFMSYVSRCASEFTQEQKNVMLEAFNNLVVKTSPDLTIEQRYGIQFSAPIPALVSSEDSVSIAYASTHGLRVVISVVDASGKVFWKKSHLPTNQRGQVTFIPPNTMPSGNYYVVITPVGASKGVFKTFFYQNSSS